MEGITAVLPSNQEALGILGHLIIVNKQVHSYQLEELRRYLTACGTTIDATCLPAILDGQEGAISFESALQAYSNESLLVQESLYYVLATLANVDDCYDGGEENILAKARKKSKIAQDRSTQIFNTAREEALSLRADNNTLFSKPYSDSVPTKGIFQRIIDWIRSAFCKLFHLKSADRTAESQEDVNYKTAIEKCAQIAKDDFTVIQPTYSTLIDKCNETVNHLESLTSSMDSKSELSSEVTKAISAFAECLSQNVLLQAQNASASLLQKERTLPDFTISLLGRTKAGKTTLHSILTGQDRDKIGVGMQRTTRYNRVYQWNLLRLIDTPGIGSAEAGGRSDDEIAASVLGESDVICFVIVDDSILQDVLEFIERVATLNKPIIILLNHKENIRPEVKYKKYLANPTDWLTTSGESNLQGHINRIQRYALDHKFDALVSVYPVFLLPALMAQEPEFAEDSKLLWESSNLDAFIEELKNWITISGPLKRSQTLIDGAVQNFTQAEKTISQGEAPVREKIQDLKKRKPAIIKGIRREQDELLKTLEDYLKEKFSSLELQEALSFAEKYYDFDGDLSPEWEAHLSRIGFEKDIQAEIDRLSGLFSSKIDDTVREVFEDFYFSFQIGIENIGFGDSISFDFRSFTRILGGLFDVAGSIALLALGSNPIGWVLAGAGVVLGLLSGLFKSKEKKRKEAIDKVYGMLSRNIHEAAPTQISNILSKFTENTDNVIKKIEKLFDELAGGLERTISIGDKLANEYHQQIDFLNRVYAWRILTFLMGSSELYQQDKVEELVLGVERSSNTIRITTSANVTPDPDALRNIITEKIDIVKMEAKS